jgi:hypothetical protein
LSSEAHLKKNVRGQCDEGAEDNEEPAFDPGGYLPDLPTIRAKDS